MVASEPGIEFVLLHYKPLETVKDQALQISKGNFDEKLTVTSEVRNCLIWWINNIKHSYKHTVRPQPQITLKSDSSIRGWRVVHTTQLKTGEHWSYTEQNRHIYKLELLAGFLTLKCFALQ